MYMTTIYTYILRCLNKPLVTNLLSATIITIVYTYVFLMIFNKYRV